MKVNKWTTGLAAAGVVSLASAAQAGDANETVMTAVSSTTLSGYVSVSALWNPGTGNAAVPGQPFRGGTALAQDSFAADVFSLSVSKPQDESEWAAGYNTQLWFAETSGAGTAPGLSIGGAIQLKNANIDLRLPVGNGIDLKVGIFDAIIGYESSDYNANPNYTRNYGWFLEPTTHEGVLASYAVNDLLSVSAGIANSYNPTVGGVANPAESQKAYMASAALTAPDSAGFLAGGSLYVGVVDGINAAGGGTTGDTTSIYVGATLPTPIEGLAVGIGWDYRMENGPNSSGTGVAGATSGAWASALAGYLSYDVTEKIAAHYRIDWAKGTDNTFGADANGTEDKLLSNTITLDYKAWENVISRLEVRWDHSLDAQYRYGVADRNDIAIIGNFIYQF
jgi:hypothetical protein